MANALEAIHSVIDPLQERLLESQRLIRTASKLTKHLDHKQKEITNSGDGLIRLQEYPKEHVNVMREIPVSCNEAHEEFHDKYSRLTDRIFIHGENKSSKDFDS